jgi:hypothetical protein
MRELFRALLIRQQHGNIIAPETGLLQCIYSTLSLRSTLV